MKAIKKVIENARHLAKQGVIEAKHEIHLTSDDRYETEQTIENLKHRGAVLAIEHNNPIIDVFNNGIDIVGETSDSIMDFLDI